MQNGSSWMPNSVCPLLRFLKLKFFSSNPMHVDMNKYAIIYKALMFKCIDHSICILNGMKLYTEYR